MFFNNMVQLHRIDLFSLASVFLQMKSIICHFYAKFHSFNIDLQSIYYVYGIGLDARETTIGETKFPALMVLHPRRRSQMKPSKYIMKR